MGSAAAVFLVVALTGAVVAGNTLAVTPYPPEWPHATPWKLTRELLLPGETKRIVFVVDRAKGYAPKTPSLDHLATIAARHGQRPASWVWLGEDGSPAVKWITPDQRQIATYTITVKEGQSLPGDYHLPQDMLDVAEFFAQRPHCLEGPLAADVSFVFVRYLGSWKGAYGSATTLQSGLGCGDREFRVIYLAQDRIARHRAPGFSREFLETRALAHEYGHVLGLASNPGHGWWSDTINYRRGAHCVHKRCAVSVPSRKAMLKGWMTDYCSSCTTDIEHAREHWLTGRMFPAAAELAQPDPTAHVARLKRHNFRDGGEAEHLTQWGKRAVGPLIDRLGELPGSREGSPRAVAARLVHDIVIAEDRKRVPNGDRRVYHSANVDHCDRLVKWWERERDSFMSGDDWSLPEGMLRVAPAD